jgi:hypothetical protein
MDMPRIPDTEPSRSSRLDGTIWETLITRRNIALLVAVLLGGGGITYYDFATKADVAVAVSDASKVTKSYSDEKFETINQVVTDQETKIDNIENKVDHIQHVQHRQVARQEARRITEKIQDRHERERNYDRLLDINIRRLRENKDPCATLHCD